jgi:GcrA cell cycle regulator
MRGEAWTDDQVQLLKTLWAAGETAEVIATRLGDISRSAVLGKVFRLRLPSGTNAKKAKEQIAVAPANSAPVRRRRGIKPAQSAAPKAERKGRTLLELTNHACRWPYRRPGTEKYFFCGAEGADLEGNVPYCPRHMKRAYLVPPPRVVESHHRVWASANRKRASAP